MDIEQEVKDICEQCQNGASISDVMEIVGRIAEQAAAAEREACAKVCSELWDLRDNDLARMHAAKCADAIRKRSNAELRGGPAVSSPERPA